MPHDTSSKTVPHYSFFTASEYRRQLVTLIKQTKPGDRLLLMSMTFEPTEPEIAQLMKETEAAAARGVHVILSVDAHSFLVSPNHALGPLWTRRRLPNRLPPLYHHKLQILERINAQATGHASIINVPSKRFNLPIAGRSHIKAAIVNNDVFVGGCNLQGSKMVDMMIHWQSRRDADNLHAVLGQIIHGKHAGRALAGVDRTLALDTDSKLFIDSGMQRQSRIFDEAMKLIDSAEQWLVLTCQFFPNSITAQHLMQAAKRGVKVEVIYSHPRHHGVIGGFGQQVSILRERTRVPKTLFKDALTKNDPMLHAKLIACDKGFMIGSHNYVRAGVILGTAEIALQSNDPELAREAVQTLHRGLKRSKLK